MAMTNYPYPASFLEPMPAWPVNEAVKAWVDIPTKSEMKNQSNPSFFQTIARYLLSDVNPKDIEKKIKQATNGLTDREKQLLNALPLKRPEEFPSDPQS